MISIGEKETSRIFVDMKVMPQTEMVKIAVICPRSCFCDSIEEGLYHTNLKWLYKINPDNQLSAAGSLDLFCLWFQILGQVKALEEATPHLVWQPAFRWVRGVDKFNRAAGGVHNNAAVLTFRYVLFDLTAEFRFEFAIHIIGKSAKQRFAIGMGVIVFSHLLSPGASARRNIPIIAPAETGAP
jgi:hypothetical protein